MLRRNGSSSRTSLARRAGTVISGVALLAVLLPVISVDARGETANVMAAGAWVPGADLPGPVVRGAGVYTATSSMEIFTTAPAITSVSPAAGPPGGGQSVVINGSNFSSVNWVSFGSTAAASFTVNSPTRITAVSPAHAAGTIHIRVNTAAGTSAATAADLYTFETAPTITSVSPAAGPPGGGQTVIINGTNFMGTNWVSFGGVAAPSFTINSPTKITAVSPAHPAGLTHVRVNTPLGTSAITNADLYTFETAPTVTSVSPVAGPSAGGQSVSIYGTNFTGTNWVSFGGVAAPSVTVNSPTKITVVTPEHTVAVVHVRVNTPLGTSAVTNADLYAYESAPTITSISPSSGPDAGGQSVVITGTNLFGANWVSFGSTAAASFTVNSPTQITATSPAHGAGYVHVRVNTPLGTSAATAADVYAYDNFGDPGFESGGLSHWTIDSSNPEPAVTNANAHTGIYSAHLGSLPLNEVAGDSSIFQQVTMPAGSSHLSFWYWPRTEDSVLYDWQDVYVTNTSGTILATVMHVCQNDQAWIHVTFDMSPYAGQTVRVKFLVHGDTFNDATDMFVDDVSVTP